MTRLFATLALFFAFSGVANAQSAKAPEVAVAVGSLFAEEDQTFNVDNLLAAAHVYMLDLPIMNAESGVAFEASNLKTDFRYAVWALSRADVAGPIYAGADVKVFDDGKGDFDMRLVVGYRVYAKLALEIYSLEENRPIAFSFAYKF